MTTRTKTETIKVEANPLAEEFKSKRHMVELERIENVIGNCEVFEPSGVVYGPDLIQRRASDQEATTARITLHRMDVDFGMQGDYWENAAREMEKRGEEFLEAAKRLRLANPRTA